MRGKKTRPPAVSTYLANSDVLTDGDQQQRRDNTRYIYKIKKKKS